MDQSVQKPKKSKTHVMDQLNTMQQFSSTASAMPKCRTAELNLQHDFTNMFCPRVCNLTRLNYYCDAQFIQSASSRQARLCYFLCKVVYHSRIWGDTFRIYRSEIAHIYYRFTADHKRRSQKCIMEIAISQGLSITFFY